ncbi:MAG: hypothetical protein MRY83_22340 [Flavobacteriales bacterium]|nr:hypothetical protein [Flavobacteriales bacterium]
MKNKKIIKILQQLSHEDVKELSKFIHSDYFSCPKLARKLYDTIIRYYPNFKESLINKERIWAKLFDEHYNDQKMRLLTSDLYRQVEHFLIYQSLKKDNLLQDQLLIKRIGQMNLPSAFQSTLNSQKKKQKNSGYGQIELLHSNLIIEEETFEFKSRTEPQSSIQNLQRISDLTDEYFLSMQLKYSCELLNREKILSQSYEYELINELITFIPTSSYIDVPLIHSYYHIFLMLKTDDEREFFYLKDKLTEYLMVLNSKELRDIYVFLLNYCIQQSNKGNAKYLKELFDLYKILLDHRIIIEGNYMHLYDFKNISTVALRVKAYNWISNFTNEYTPYLSLQYRESAIAFNMARISYQKGALKEATKFLLNVDFADTYYEIGARSLLIKIFFEEDNYDLFIANVNSFKQYIDRNKSVTDHQNKLHSNFLKWIKRLYKVKEGKRRNFRKWHDEFRNDILIADKTWLEDKFVELS